METEYHQQGGSLATGYAYPVAKASAKTIAHKRKKQVGITYNKGGYQYITEMDLKTLGR